MFLIQRSVADLKANRSCITARPEVDGLPVCQILPDAVAFTETRLVPDADRR
jgi:hypothetical protein